MNSIKFDEYLSIRQNFFLSILPTGVLIIAQLQNSADRNQVLKIFLSIYFFGKCVDF